MAREAKAGLSRQGVSWEQATTSSKEFLPYAKEHDQTYIDFLEAFAKSSGRTRQATILEPTPSSTAR